MAGIDVARHGSRLAGLAVAGAGGLSAAGQGDQAQSTNRHGLTSRWLKTALAASLLVHVAAVMLLIPLRSQPLSVPAEESFQLVFEPPAKTAPSAVEAPVQAAPSAAEPSLEPEKAIVEPPVQSPPAVPAIAQEIQRPADPPAAVAQLHAEPAPEPQEPSPPAAQAVAPERPPAKPPAPKTAPKASVVARHTVHPAAPFQRSVEAPHAPAPSGATAPSAATGSFVPPSPVAGMETNRAPIYPPSALRRGEQGNVMLRVSVSADGAPLAVDLAATSGFASLDSAAAAAVRQWRFNPATRAGIAVAAITDVPIRFRINN